MGAGLKRAARAAKASQTGNVLPTKVWQEIGNMLDHWEQLPNDLIGQIEEECPELVRSIDKIASSPQFGTMK